MVFVLNPAKMSNVHLSSHYVRTTIMPSLNVATVILGVLLSRVCWAKSLDPASKSLTWDPNYCNDTKAQEAAGLTKTALGQFLGYACDTTFFQCRFSVEGWKTYKKVCRKGLVFDRAGTQNCNYDFNVEGCGMKQCADCIGEQFACCLSEECVDLGMRCDGKYDCSLEEDEQNCPSCSAGEFPCVLSEQCVPIEKRCNGVKECKDGTDELHCDECDADMFWCLNSKKCIEKELRCDGNRDCNMGEDEAFCSNLVQKDYMCEDQQNSISKKDLCNGFPDCPDGSDELYCNGVGADMEEQPLTAAPTRGATQSIVSKLPLVSVARNITKQQMVDTRMTTKFAPTLRGVVTKTFPRILPTTRPASTATSKPRNASKKESDYFYDE